MSIIDFPKINKNEHVHFSDIIEGSADLSDLITNLQDFQERHGNHPITIDTDYESSSINAYVTKTRIETDDEHRSRCQAKMSADARTKEWNRKEYERLKAIFDKEDE